MTVTREDDAVEPAIERPGFVDDPATLALFVAAGLGLVGGALVGVAAALALAAGSAAAAAGLAAAIGFAVTTVAVFEAGRRTAAS